MELLLAEAALPLSYPECVQGLDSNQQHAITHNFGPSEKRAGKKRWWMFDCCSA